jgi:hypothetical protein
MTSVILTDGNIFCQGGWKIVVSIRWLSFWDGQRFA